MLMSCCFRYFSLLAHRTLAVVLGYKVRNCYTLSVRHFIRRPLRSYAVMHFIFNRHFYHISYDVHLSLLWLWDLNWRLWGHWQCSRDVAKGKCAPPKKNPVAALTVLASPLIHLFNLFLNSWLSVLGRNLVVSLLCNYGVECHPNLITA